MLGGLMKYLFLSLMLLIPSISVPCTCQCGPQGPIKSLIQLKRYLSPRLSPKSVPVDKLAPAIRRASIKFHVPERMIASVMLVESRGISNATSNTKDYGIMQIAPSHKVSQECLHDWQCNLDFGVFLLARTTRVCEYNVGPNWKNKLKACKKYETKLEAI